ncbi:MAG: phage baseplate assembly protein V [Acidimicrobiia bacterium]
MPTTGILAPSLKVDGAPLPEERWLDVVELRVDLVASAPTQLSLRLADFKGAHASAFPLGAEIEVGVPDVADPGAVPRVVSVARCEITEVGFDAPEDGVPELVVIAHDKSHRLGLASVARSYQNTSANDVLSALAQTIGLTWRNRVDSGAFTTPMTHFMAADSALALLNELTSRVGAQWSVTPDRVLEATQAGSGATVEATYGTTLRSCSVRTSARHPSQVTVGAWDHTTMRRVAHTERATPIRPDNVASSSTEPFGSNQVLVTSARAADLAEAKALAATLARRSAARCLDVRGVLLARGGLRPGHRLNISGFPPIEGTFDVQRVEHVFRPSGTFETRFTAGERSPTSLGDDALGAAGTRASSIRFDGLVVAVVTDNNDPDKLGRVKVKFPWLTEEHASGWARVLAFGAGKGGGSSQARGASFVPEVEDEVLVGFEGGDFRKPVVLGTVHNATTKAPTWERDGSGKVVTRSITSRLGHVFEMSDGAGPDKRHLVLRTSDGKTTLRVGEDRVDVETPSGKPISLKSGRASITITDKGDISIAGANVTITAEANLSIEAKANAKVKAGANGSLEANAVASVKGGPSAEIQSTGATVVKGSMVKIN